MYKKILIATDDSKNAKRAVEHAIGIARLTPEATIELLYVLDPGSSKSNLLNDLNSEVMVNKYKERISESERMIKEANIPFKSTVLIGFPGLEIIEHAHKNQFELVVIGSRGLNALQDFVLGSVSYKVAKLSKCPVLIVK